MIRIRRYSCGATAALLGYSAARFSTLWPGLVSEGKLPKPLALNRRRPKFPADIIDQIVTQGQWLNEFEPALPRPGAVEGDAELSRRAAAIAGID